jgi:predicted XRE-type DNA-binding protein
MTTITIHKGTNFGKEISGTFELLGEWFPETLSSEDAAQGDGKVFVNINGKKKGVWVFKSDIEISGVSKKIELIESVDDMKSRIQKRFNVMGLMTNGLIQGNIRSLIISGAAGIGKTYSLDKALSYANDTGAIEYKSVNGKISGIGLYCRLWESRFDNSVLLIDDVDVFSDMDILNLLKAALDSGEKRKVCWSTASSFLEEKDIPNEFEFEGTVVFITNVDIDRELERGSKLAPHLQALVSRSVYLDLGVHTNEEIMIRVTDVIMTTNMLQKRGLANSEVIEVLDFMKENVSRLRNVSLRTALYLADFVATDRKNWKDIAEVTMLK